MPKTRRRRADREQFWRDTITAWKTSGQSVRAFCAARGVVEATFFARRRELARREQHQQPTAPAQRPSFAAVRVIPEPIAEVVLPTGLVVRVSTEADPAAVARLVAALGAASC
jgi:transposase